METYDASGSVVLLCPEYLAIRAQYHIDPKAGIGSFPATSEG